MLHRERDVGGGPPRAGGRRACRRHNLGVVQQRGLHARRDVRCHVVAPEVNVYAIDGFLVASPPVQTLRVVLSLAARVGPAQCVS